MSTYCAKHIDSGGGVMAASKPLSKEEAEKYAAARGGAEERWSVVQKDWPSGKEI